jgi:hypothetical protein
MLERYANFINLFMGWSKHLRVGTFILMKWSKGLVFIRMKKKLVFTRKKVGVLLFFDLLCGWHIIDWEWHSYVGVCQRFTEKEFSIKDLGEAPYMLGIMIYRDRSKRLVRLSLNTYIDKVLKQFNMEQSKKRVLTYVTWYTP